MRLVTLLLCLISPSRAGVIALPAEISAPVLPTGAHAGLPGTVLAPSFSAPSLLSLTPSLTPSPLPSALIPSRAVAVAAAAPALPETPEPTRARSLNNFWDGLEIELPDLEEPAASAVPLAGLSDEPLVPERLAPWLETDDAKIAAALDRAVAIARTTRAGRRALDAAEKTLNSEGRTLPVLVLDLGRNYGEYDYLEKNVRLHSGLFKKGREAELAGTIIHEMTHVAQHGEGVPSNALEMEIEAHLTDLEMLAELGVKPRAGTFARQALDYLAQGPEKFVELLQAAVPGTIYLGDSSLEDIEEQLEEDLATYRKRAKRSKTAAALVPVIERDLAFIQSPEGAASYRAFSKRVLALLKRRAAELQ